VFQHRDKLEGDFHALGDGLGGDAFGGSKVGKLFPDRMMVVLSAGAPATVAGCGIFAFLCHLPETTRFGVISKPEMNYFR
jgi:hypothetical protein